MTGKTKAICKDIVDCQSENITLKIWSKTGESFQRIFPIDRTTFAYVKYLAIQVLVNENEIENYKLISIKTRKTIDEKKTLEEENVIDGDEYLLTRKLQQKRLSNIRQTSESSSIDGELIDYQTEDLPLSLNLSHQAHCLIKRTEFRTDFNRIVLTLIEISQKLLWYHSDAEQIFKQVERILSKSSVTLDTDDNEKIASSSFYSQNIPFITFRQLHQQYFQPNPIAIQSLEQMGFYNHDIIEALRICHNDKNLACDYLLGDKRQQQSIINANDEQILDPNSCLFQSMMENSFIQQAINNPKIFFVLIQLYENPNLITMYIYEPDIGNLFLQINRIYHIEKYEMNVLNSN